MVHRNQLNDGEEKQVFLSLAPRSGRGYAKSYTDGLDFAFSEQSICNIGIVGPYASGKTTVLKSYETDCGQKYVYITLGDYVRSTVQSPQVQKPLEPDSDELADTANNSSGSKKSVLNSTKQKRAEIADLQDRIIEQLLCYESPYGFWRSSITRFWRGANNGFVSAFHVVTIMFIIANLFIGLDVFGVATQACTAVEANNIASAVSTAENKILEDTALRDRLVDAAKAEVTRSTNNVAKEQSLTNDERDILLNANLERAAIDAQNEWEGIAAAKGEEAKREALHDGHPAKVLFIIRLVCCILALVCIALLIRHEINSGITIGSLSLGPGSVNMHSPTLPFQSKVDDIIYLFRRTGRTVFVFEDLDRMDQKAEILTSLRELNYKLNVYEKTLNESGIVALRIIRKAYRRIRKVNPKVYKFVYCIQAGCIPDAEERSKFFDFILPVVSHGDASSFGDLLNNHLENKKEYKPDSELLQQAGYAIIGMRMYENLVNEYIVHRNVLGNDAAESPSVAVMKNNTIFAIVAYKNICPIDFAQFERREGFLHEILSIETKEQVLEGIGQARDSSYRDKRLPYSALYKIYGRYATWDSALTSTMRSVAAKHAYAGDWRDEVYDFVQYSLERGHIREDVRNYASLDHKSLGSKEREFCSFAMAKYWGEKAASHNDLYHAFTNVEPKAIAQMLPSCIFMANERALNAGVLDFLAGQVDLDRELRENEEDPLLELLYTLNGAAAAKFFCKYIYIGSVERVERFHAVATSPRYGIYGLLPSFASVNNALGGNGVAWSQMAVIAFLRLASYAAADEKCGLFSAEDVATLKNLAEGEEFTASVWHKGWDAYSVDTRDDEIGLYTQFNPIADEIARGMQKLGCKVQYLDDTHEELLGALTKHGVYAINAPNVQKVLEREGLNTRLTGVLTTILNIGNKEHHLVRRLKSDCGAFVSMVANEARDRGTGIYDTSETIYWVLENLDEQDDVLQRYLKFCTQEIDLERVSRNLIARALCCASCTKQNLDLYIRFVGVTMDDELYSYLKRYASKLGEKGVDNLNSVEYVGIGQAAIRRAKEFREPLPTIQALQELFGDYGANLEQVHEDVEQLRDQCRKTHDYTPLGKYIAKNVDAYKKLLEDKDFRRSVRVDEIDSTIQASDGDDSADMALMFGTALPEYSATCILSLKLRLERLRQPIWRENRTMHDCCKEMGYEGLAELFEKGKTERLTNNTDEWKIANTLVENGIATYNAGAYVLV